ncbi:fasciclin domain-containing protein [Nocardioides ferulae]|uniref:fasciclin domain-containing protein n=1 Tax=Nocardioides ferulae TaxID=2340821 RepID=UPI000EAB622F|nr:fasciclin domain-containing protein [Nocardioides ferulae]
MKLQTLRRTGVAAAALSLSLGLAACSEENGGDTAAADAPASETTEMTDEMTEDESMGSDTEMDEASAASQVFGPGCAAVPTDGAGSFDGMVADPVATAASNNPLLTTLVTAVGEAGLVDTLNDAEGLTVFAPTDDAFAKIPAKDLKAVLADKDLLTSILTHHVVAGQLGPDEIAGEHETLNGDMIEVMGSGEEFTVGDEEAAVICGNVPTANATVYVVDTVLMP